MNLPQRIGRGLEAGGLAGAGIAVLFFTSDVLRFAPFRTVTELARPLFMEDTPLSVEGPVLTDLASSAAGVATYSLLHFATFAALGFLATWVIPGRSFWGTLSRGALFGAAVCTGVFLLGRTVADTALLVGSVSPLGLVLANAMAGTIMAAVFAVHEADAGA